MNRNLSLLGEKEKLIKHKIKSVLKILPRGNFVDKTLKLISTKWQIDFTQGGSRWCILIGEYAIKIPKVEPLNTHSLFAGLNGNYNEWRLWEKERNTNTGKLLCPIVGGLPPFFIVMPRLELPRSEAEYDRSEFDMFLDPQINNMGYYQTQIVQLDYGSYGGGFPIANLFVRIASIPGWIEAITRSLIQAVKKTVRLEYFNCDNILIINFWNYQVRIGINRSGMKGNISERKLSSQHPKSDLLPVLLSLPFGLLNIYPRYNPFPEGKLINSGQFILRLEPQLRRKIRRPHNPQDFGFLNGRFVVVNYSFFK